MSKERFEKLIQIIKFQHRITETEICSQMGYRPGYISQVRSRGNIPDKFMDRLMEKYQVDESDLAADSLLKENDENYSSGNRFSKNMEELIAIIKMQQETIHTLTTLLNKEKRTA